MNKFIIFGSAFCAVATFGLLVHANYRISEPESVVVANIRGPGGLNITARNTAIMLDDSGDTAKIVVVGDRFETGIGLRDKHTREAIETNKYPNVTLSIPNSLIHVPEDSGKTVISTVNGSLTFHGTVKDVQIMYKLKNDCQGHLTLDASMNIDIRDFGVKPPSYLGIGIKPEVNIHTNLTINTDSKC